jgi:hypothetical protein
MGKRETMVAAFLATAAAVLVFMYLANYVLPNLLYWPGVLVSLPGLPLIVLCDLLFGDSLHTVYFFTFPALAWGAIAAGVAWLATLRSSAEKRLA